MDASDNKWMSLLDYDYSNLIYELCNKHHHYLDTVIHGLDIVSIGEYNQDDCAFTALDKDVFLPLRLYTGEDGKSILFDSRCTLVVTPYASSFLEE